MRPKRVIAIILWVFAACGLIIMLTRQATLSDTVPPIFIFTIIGLLLYFSKDKKKVTKEEFMTTLSVKHFNGLPIPEDTRCTIQRTPNGFAFTANNNTFNLTDNKITDLCVKTDVEIQKQYVSSIGGAVGGAVLFGPLGAMIGGRAKQKSSKTITQYLIFTYLKDNGVAYISFEIDRQPDLMRANILITRFNQSPHAQAVVDL